MTKGYRSIQDMVTDLLDKDFSEQYAVESKKHQIGRMFFALRNKKGLTQKELAKKLGVSQSTVSKFEDAENGDIAIKELRKFSEALELSVEIRIHEREMKATDLVKYHFFELKKQLDHLREISKGDQEIERGVARFTEEAFWNINVGLLDCLSKVREPRQRHAVTISGPYAVEQNTKKMVGTKN